MKLADRIELQWRLLRANTPGGRRFRSRILAGAALGTLLGGILASAGLAEIIEAMLVLAGLAVCAAGVLVFVNRHGRHSMARAGSLLGETQQATGKILVHVGSRARVGTKRGAAFGSATVVKVRRDLPKLAASASQLTSTTAERVAAAGKSAAERTPQRPTSRRPERARHPASDAIGKQREALQLNAAGVELRRNGAYSDAAEQHKAALSLLREIDDRKTTALTLNNLALALSHSGDDNGCVVLFEEAAGILHDLGDEQHEGQVIANLGLAHRRHGRPQESENVLQLALTKLVPSSSAYRTVEAELRRAS
jgi:tetratricopeptide (TPR) repeat protein